MKNWRPKEGWNNPYSETDHHPDYLNGEFLHTGRDILQRREQSYEAGADAMLEAIIKRLRDIHTANLSIYYGTSCRRIADMLEIKDDD